MDFKVERIHVNLPVRELNTTWTLEEQGETVYLNLKFSSSYHQMASDQLSMGWTEVTDIVKWGSVTTEWLKENIKHGYSCYGTIWTFENANEAIMFKLRWQ